MPKTSSPMPATKDASTSVATEAPSPSATIGLPSSETATMPRSRGRGRATRSSTTVATSACAASADSTQPHACRQIVSPASAGPRVSHAPTPIALSRPKATTTTQSQVVPRNSRHPSRSSSMVERGGPVGGPALSGRGGAAANRLELGTGHQRRHLPTRRAPCAYASTHRTWAPSRSAAGWCADAPIRIRCLAGARASASECVRMDASAPHLWWSAKVRPSRLTVRDARYHVKAGRRSGARPVPALTRHP